MWSMMCRARLTLSWVCLFFTKPVWSVSIKHTLRSRHLCFANLQSRYRRLEMYYAFTRYTTVKWADCTQHNVKWQTVFGTIASKCSTRPSKTLVMGSDHYSMTVHTPLYPLCNDHNISLFRFGVYFEHHTLKWPGVTRSVVLMFIHRFPQNLRFLRVYIYTRVYPLCCSLHFRVALWDAWAGHSAHALNALNIF